MPGRREDDEMEVTLGEVYRLVKSVKVDHGLKLDAIDAQVRRTNERTTAVESEVRELQRARANATATPTLPILPITTPEGESLSIKMTPKVWGMFVGGLAGLQVLVPYLKGWVMALFTAKP